SSAAVPKYTQLASGQWWNPTAPPATPEVSVSEDAAKILRISLGSDIEWSTPSRRFHSRVVAIHRTDATRLASRVEWIFSPSSLTSLPVIYYGSLRVKPELVPEIQKLLYQQFPTVTVVNLADVMAIIQDVVNQISIVVRFISGFAMFAGVIILASS